MEVISQFLTVIFKRGVYTGQLIIITNGTSISTNKSISYIYDILLFEYIHICNSHSSTQGDIGQFKDGQDPGAFLSGFNNLNMVDYNIMVVVTLLTRLWLLKL